MKYFVIILFLISGRILFAQISPGDLTNAHADLEGMSNCTKCHEIGEPVHNSKCLGCHTEIKNLIDDKRGYHSSKDVSNKDCSNCHSEHHGRNFQIIRFEEKKFDHKLTGYSLEGKHRGINCEDCHKASNISDNKIKKRAGTYLGLSKKCIDCHTDYHQKTLSINCESCHGFNAFRPAAKFNHSSAKFILDGAHQNVNCERCHLTIKRNGQDFQIFKGVKFNSCLDCHKDIHEGKFGTNCESCHSTESFGIIKNKANFNHDRTGFKLIGKHNFVECNQCHKNGLTAKLKFGNCTDCHVDFHKGQFVEINKVRDCKECHNEDGFKPSLFTIENHNKLKFSLMGGHLAVPCENCHVKENIWKFKFDNNKCINCHENIHGNSISQEFWNNGNCESCHVFENWHVVNFNHSVTGFELLGVHKTIQCSACHKNNDNNTVKYIFSQLESSCEKCHKDIHYGQFQKMGKTNCESCHAFMNWEPVKFSHTISRFKLDGAHMNVACIKCHPKVTENGFQFVKYQFSEIKCSNCHS
ncbi:MAG: cytochrome C [Ignavibacteria bacterium GWB2_35_6b]|nr:MAG: cytochrome C [Ignavibacteria bacterium GWB2_35_6b]